MLRKHKGAWAELTATAWLLDQGYEVFRNVSPHGDTDIIARKPGEILEIDVTCGSVRIRADGSQTLQYNGKSKSPAYVRVLVVLPDGTCQWGEKGIARGPIETRSYWPDRRKTKTGNALKSVPNTATTANWPKHRTASK